MPMPAGFTLRRQVALLPEPPDFAAELLRYHYATRYEGRLPDESTEKQLTRRIRQWEAEIPALDGIPGINADPPPSHAR
jgi:hypothetical protein